MHIKYLVFRNITNPFPTFSWIIPMIQSKLAPGAAQQCTPQASNDTYF